MDPTSKVNPSSYERHQGTFEYSKRMPMPSPWHWACTGETHPLASGSCVPLLSAFPGTNLGGAQTPGGPNRLAVVFVGKAHCAAVFHFGVNLGVGCYWFSRPKGRLLSNSDDSRLGNGRHGTTASIQTKHNSPCFLSNSGCLPARPDHNL